MLIVNKVGAGVVGYFTAGVDRGAWTPGARRLLGVEGHVDPVGLRRVLQGCDPATGRYLPRQRPARRRAGWDLVFGAPKSVSLLAASLPDEVDRAAVSAAHSAAVTGVLGHLDGRLTSRRAGPNGRSLAGEGLIGARFEHAWNAAREPHLHTHVLVANLTRAAGSWGAVAVGPWYLERMALAGLYQLELRHQLARHGFDLEWRIRPDGLADVAGIPRAAMRAASTQGRQASSIGWGAARRGAALQPWADRLAAVPAVATEPLQAQRHDPTRASRTSGLEDPELARRVQLRLATGRSDFRRADVIVALATCHPAGAPAVEVADWVDRFCAGSAPRPSPTSGPRWATPVARRFDDELLTALERRASGGAGAVPAEFAEDLLREVGLLGLPQRQAVRDLTASERDVLVLGVSPGRSELLAQADVLAVCREIWSRAGASVAVSAPDAESAQRWSVLAGLAPYRAGDRVDVLVVDRADRRPSADLLRLLEGGAERLVLVEGGTRSRLTNPASHALDRFGREAGRVAVGPHQAWAASGRPAEEYGPLVGRAAAEALIARWPERPGSLLVGLGLPEVRALNRAIVGQDRPDAGVGRFAPGDRVMVCRSKQTLPVYGTLGVVEQIGPQRRGGSLSVRWADGSGTRSADRSVLAAIGFGYAATPRLAARSGSPLLVLGPAEAMDRGRGRVVAEVARPGRGPDRLLGVP